MPGVILQGVADLSPLLFLTQGSDTLQPINIIISEHPPCGLIVPLLQYAPCEASMPFSLRPHQRFPVYCSVTYHAGFLQGRGTVWNFSLSGWKLSGDVPLQVGQTCSLTVHLPIEGSIVVTAAIVRWVRGQEFGLETLAIEKQTHSRVEHVITRLVEESGQNIE